ncbi:hypothetical protein NX059_001523 [Plenodomus lindquistii]|nr:hypothetical protein NX059_001523 [Plenodomus lindquistii]
MAAPRRSSARIRHDRQLRQALNTPGAAAPPPPQLHQLRTPAQKRRDTINARISKNWIKHKPAGQVHAKGIHNPNAQCYMNAALQAMMHQPSLLNWIRSHNVRNGKDANGNNLFINPCNPNPTPYARSGRVPRNCMACEMKNLIAAYWTQTARTTAIPSATGPMRLIARMAFDSGIFQQHVQDDSDSFYTFVMDQLSKSTALQSWTDEYEALIQTLGHYKLTCSSCATTHTRGNTAETQIVIRLTNPNHNWNSVLASYFRNQQATAICPTCLVTRNHTEDLVIDAAPQIFRITVSMAHADTLKKIHHRVQHPEILDLTKHQENKAIPLKYRLSSVVSHDGLKVTGGHYMASVRGPSSYRFISDSHVETFTKAQFVHSPQQPLIVATGNKETHILTYIRESRRGQVAALLTDS